MPKPPLQLVVVDTETTGLDPVRDCVIDIGAVRLDADLRGHRHLEHAGRPGPRAAPADHPSHRHHPGRPRRRAALRPGLRAVARVRRRRAHRRSERRLRPGHARRSGGALRRAAAAAPQLRHARCRSAAVPRDRPPRTGRSWPTTLGLGEPPHRALPDAQVTAALLAALRRRAAGPRRRSSAACSRRRRGRRCALLDALGRGDVPSDEAARAAATGARTSSMPRRRVPADGRPADAALRGRRLARRLRRAAARSRPPSTASPCDRARSISPPRWPPCSTPAASACSRPAPAWARASPICCRPPFARPPAARASTVSTKTKALQRQLAERELPLLASCLPPGFRWTLLMGRENYLCRRRLDEAVADAGHGLPERDRLLALAWLAGRARRGEVDVSALPYGATQALPALAETARELRASAAACLGGRCRARGDCHWRRARADARAAHLVCVNHALLLSGGETLPPFDDLVVDEAHLLPDEAVSTFTERVDRALDRRSARRGARPARPPSARRRGAHRRRQGRRRHRRGTGRGGRRFRARRAHAARPRRRRRRRARRRSWSPPLSPTPTPRPPSSTVALCCSPPVCRSSPCSTPSPAPAGPSRRRSPSSPGRPRRPPRPCPRSTASALAPSRSAPTARPRPRLLTDVTRVPPAELVFWAELAGAPRRRPSRAPLAPARAWSLNCAPLSPAGDHPRAPLGPAAQRRAGQRHPRRGRLVCLLPRRSRAWPPSSTCASACSPRRSTTGARRRSCSSTTPTPATTPASSRRASPNACGVSPSSPAAGCSPCSRTGARSRRSRS